MDLQIVTTEDFNGISCNFYSSDGQIYMTRNQIGQALGYSEPRKMIAKIHERHKERLDKFSGVVNLGTPSGVQETFIYSQRGVFEICRWSQQPKADAFMDWVWDIIEAYHNRTLELVQKKPLIPRDDFSILCSQVNEMENTLDNFYDRLNAIEEIINHSASSTLAYTGIEQKSIIDPIRDNIERLAILYNDGSKGYNCTFRKVYLAMGIDWEYRRTRYKNQRGNKNVPSKIHLIESDKKLLKLFVGTVENLITQAESNR